MDNNPMPKTSSRVRRPPKRLVDSQQIRFATYSQFHGKYEPVGSDYLRVGQLIKYWPEADLYKYGENPEVLIFTKVFVSQDYQFPKHFQGFKILDICDPMWLEGFNVVETAQCMNAVTCPTEPLAEFIRQFHDNVIVIPDRFDLEIIPAPHKHLNEAKTVVWFGYSQNAELLRPALRLIEELGLSLICISNDDNLIRSWVLNRDKYKFKKYNEETIYRDLQQADFAVLPEGNRPEDVFKSNNKTIKANLAGLPVAKTADDMRFYMNPKERQKWVDNNYAKIQGDYSIKRSIEQYKAIINDQSS